jgi:ABC-type dipeptide/oligopeptide/nickel transport system permease subunit
MASESPPLARLGRQPGADRPSLRRWLAVRHLRAAARWKTFSLGAILIGLFVGLALLAPVVAPGDPTLPDYTATLQRPSWHHLLGTDDQGRDILSRIIFGTRVSFRVAVIAVSLATVVGVPTGLLSGYFGGWIDGVISRFLDAMFAFPVILMAIAVLAVLGTGVNSAMVAIGLISIPEYARVSRAAMIAEKENDYVLAARAIGCDWPRVIFRGILPNTLGPILVLLSLGFAFAILNESALSFLGLGAQPPTPSWGYDLAIGQRYLFDAPWLAIFPGLAIFLLVLALNLAGDGLRDLMDPRQTRR